MRTRLLVALCAGGVAVLHKLRSMRLRTLAADVSRPLDYMNDNDFDAMLRGAGLDTSEFDLSIPRAEVGTDWNGAVIAEDGALVFVLRFDPEWLSTLGVLWEHYLDDHGCKDVDAAMGTVLEQMMLAAAPMGDAYTEYMMTDDGLETMRDLRRRLS